MLTAFTKSTITDVWENPKYDSDPANTYLFKFCNTNTRKRCEVCSKLTIKTLERRQWCRSDVCSVNFEHTSHLFLVFLLLSLNRNCLLEIFCIQRKFQLFQKHLHFFKTVFYDPILFKIYFNVATNRCMFCFCLSTSFTRNAWCHRKIIWSSKLVCNINLV